MLGVKKKLAREEEITKLIAHVDPKYRRMRYDIERLLERKYPYQNIVNIIRDKYGV